MQPQRHISGITARALKAVGIFGGTQMWTILCSIIRSKLVALWIGPVGFGLFSIFNSAIDLIVAISSMGIRSSAVRDLATGQGNRSRLAALVTIVARWGFMLGLAGAAVTLAAAPLLSKWTFGDYSHAWQFAMLSLAVALNTASSSRLAIFQGLDRLATLARASLWGATAGLAVSIPMFYFWRVDSIIPSILAYSLAAALAAFCSPLKYQRAPQPVTWHETFTVGRSFIILGFFITLSDILNQLSVYIFIAWLNINADASVVGFYQAGNTLFNRYVGLIFSAIAMEYYPRLASVASSPRRTSLFVAHQAALSSMLIMAVVSLFIVLLPLIIRILYTAGFETIRPFATVAVTGTVLRALSWCVAMVILARGDGRMFLFTEGASAVIYVALNILFYRFWGLTGLGVAYVVWYLAYVAIVIAVYVSHYRLSGLGRSIPAVLLAFGVVVAVAAAALTGHSVVAWTLTIAAWAVTARFLLARSRARR